MSEPLSLQSCSHLGLCPGHLGGHIHPPPLQEAGEGEATGPPTGAGTQTLTVQTRLEPHPDSIPVVPTILSLERGVGLDPRQLGR